MPRILVSDSISEEGIKRLEEEGMDVDVRTNLTQDELIQEIGKYDAMIVRSQTKITANVVKAAENLKIIGRAGVGVDNIDIDAATEQGIFVVNAPEGNTISAAEHTIAMLTTISRNIPQANQSLKSRKWERSKFTGVEVRDKTLGVIGLGRIGAEVARRAAGLQMKILAYDPFISKERAEELGAELASLEEVVSRADYVTVHTPLTNETRNLIDHEEFELMKDGVRVLNCARGGIINEEALYDALKNGKVAAAALDVFEEEPPFDSPLLDLDNVVVTPHLGASTGEAQVSVAVTAAEEIISALSGDAVRNAVNMPSMKPDEYKRIKPFLPLAEKMGKLLGQLADGPYEKVEVTYCGDVTEYDVNPLTRTILQGLLSPVLGESANMVNAPIIAKDRGIKVVESKSGEAVNYNSLVSIKAHTEGEVKTIAGTILGKGEPRIVQIDDYYIDVEPSGYMIVARHKDHPNIIGPCCVILGENQINISGMHCGRMYIGSTAVMILNVDSPVSPEILEEIQKVNGIIDAKLVYL